MALLGGNTKATPVDRTGDGLVNIAELTDQIIKLAIEQHASDIHFETHEKGLLIRMRIDGMLREEVCIMKSIEANLIFRIKLESKMRIDEHMAPQDGRITFNIDGKKYDTRVSVIPTTMGEKIVIRILSKEGQSFSLTDMGFRGRELEILRKNYMKPYGMILSTGPTGSGKTTTLYAILMLLNSPEKNITTIEDPVEYEIEGVNHIQINPKADLTFANGLRSILRQDPNIIMVGEIRDKETAKIAINSAMTGHLVLSTIHTNDAVTTIPRLVDMDVDPFLIASTLTVVVAQRLARRLCDSCKQQYAMSKEELDELAKIRVDMSSLIKEGDLYYKEVGCPICRGTGYKGRVGLYEVFEINEKIRKLISEGAETDAILDAAKQDGFQSMTEDGLGKAKEGITSIAEIMRVTVMKE